MNTFSENQYFVKIYVDKSAACLAGYDQHGTIERTVKPSELTEQHRQTLVDINFSLGETNTGAKIDGTESIEQLLDRAYAKILADQEKEQKRIDEAIEILTKKIIENSPYNPHHIDERTGRLEIEPNKHALIQITAEKADKAWEDRYFYRSVGSLYFGKDKSIDEIRARVLANPAVIERIASLDPLADHIQAQLDRAKEVRDKIAAERAAESKRLEKWTAAKRKEQLASFVLTHMSDVDQRKWVADLLPESDILNAYADHVFLKLDNRFKPVGRAALENDVHQYYFDDFGIKADCGVGFLDREPDSLADEAFLRSEAIAEAVKEIYPAAKAEILVLVGYLKDYSDALDPELLTPVIRVSVTDGELEFSREYYLEVKEG